MDYLSHSASFWFKEDGKRICERIKNWLVKPVQEEPTGQNPMERMIERKGFAKRSWISWFSPGSHFHCSGRKTFADSQLIASDKRAETQGSQRQSSSEQGSCSLSLFSLKTSTNHPWFRQNARSFTIEHKNKKRKSRKQSSTVIGWKQRNASAWKVAEKWRNEKWTERLIWRKEEKVWLMESALK